MMLVINLYCLIKRRTFTRNETKFTPWISWRIFFHKNVRNSDKVTTTKKKMERMKKMHRTLNSQKRKMRKIIKKIKKMRARKKRLQIWNLFEVNNTLLLIYSIFHLFFLIIFHFYWINCDFFYLINQKLNDFLKSTQISLFSVKYFLTKLICIKLPKTKRADWVKDML